MRIISQSKKLFFLFVVISLFFQVQSFAQEDRGVGNVKVRDENGKEREVKLYDASYALVIGASKYNNGWSPLPGAKDDIPAVRKSLERHGFIVEELLDPTSVNLLPTLRTFVNNYGFNSGNRLLIYFAGHGFTETTEFGRQFGYIVPIDAPNPTKDLNLFQQRAITMAEIETVARRIRSRHALFIFDSCFSGTLLNARRSNVPAFITEKVTKPVRQFISSGTANQEVPDVSIFRRQFVAGLNGEADRNGDKYITGTELAEFLKEKVTNYTRGSQTPQSGKIFDEYLDKGDFVFTVPAANANIDRTPSRRARAVVLANRALNAMMRANLKDAEKLSNEALILDSNNAIGYGIRGWLKDWNDNDYQSARKDLEKSVRLNPNNLLFQARLAVTYQKLEDNEFAKKSAERVLRNSSLPRTAIDYYARGNIYYILEKYEEAISDYEKTIKLDKKFILAYINRLGIYYIQGKYDEIIKEVTTNNGRYLSCSNCYYLRGNAFLKKEKYDEAISDFTRALKIKPKFAFAYHNRGFAYNLKKEYDNAFRDYTNALVINSEYASAYNGRGLISLNTKNYDKAIEDFSRAIYFDPKFDMAYYNRGLSYQNKNNYDLAINDYHKAIELNPKDVDYYKERASVYFKIQNYDQAIRDYNKVIKLNPNFGLAYNNRGNAYYEKGDYWQSIRDSSRAIEINPKYARAYHDRAYAYKKIGEEAKAEADLKKYRELGGTSK